MVLTTFFTACLLALGSADNPGAREDTLTLLQTAVDADIQEEGFEVKPSDNEAVQFGQVAQAAIQAGDKMEVIVLRGQRAGTWIKCRIIGLGSQPGTYNIYIPSAPKQKRIVTDIPANALRPGLSDMEARADGLLLFWAVSGKDTAMELVRKNIEHLRTSYNGKADVYLLHYDGEKAAWLARDEPWYQKNVQFSEERVVPKQLHASASMLFAAEYYPLQLKFARKLLPELLAKRHYEYVWLLDEDLDFRGTNLTRLVEDARSSEALIVAPSARFEDRLAHRAAEKMYTPGCIKKQAMCFVHVPKPLCNYRYVNFVEALFPLLTPEAFAEFAACEQCEDQIDRIWCARAAKQLQTPAEQTCAILDQVSVVHTNGKTLRKWEAVDRRHTTLGLVANLHSEDWVDPDDIKEYQCVH